MIFDSTVPVGGAEALYVEATGEQLSAADASVAIAAYSRRSEASGARGWSAADISPPAPFRLYRATASARSVLGPRDERLPL